jgi:hypothetical protein
MLESKNLCFAERSELANNLAYRREEPAWPGKATRRGFANAMVQ